MMVQLLFVFVIALLAAFAVSFGYRRHRPWSFWTLLAVLFLAGLTVSLWTRPVGPLVWGFAWLPVVMGSFIIALLILALGTTPPLREGEAEPSRRVEGAAAVYIWFLLASMGLVLAASFI